MSGERKVDSTPTRLRSLADAYPDGILGATRDGVVTILNAQGAALLGIDPQEAATRPLGDVLRLLDQDGRTWLDVNRPFDSISTVRGVPEQSWLNASGDEVLTTAKLVRNEPLGPVLGIAVGLRSGRGRARLDRERSDLVATVAHELRSPLTGVKGFVQALLNRWDKLTDDQRKLMLTTVNADADRLARLIAELLDVARIDTDRLQLYPRESSAEVLVRRVVDSIEAGTSREIRLDVEADLPDVFADPDKFTQVVTNLVENAIRHGQGEVRVGLARAESPYGVRITVDDEGDGIPVELRRRVFTKFWTTGDSGGSGLGMYIVGGLARAHGGWVTIDDAPGGGARVMVDWPSDDQRPD
ncbi:PAS domain-containing sensor histidine kinase [Nocardioides KLBMP 9356]|uniref:histidine kinase n=1 Tax=Nocardioides potassii TaxID=2911371 RepID=A0ABS9HGQ7_9ACTN|nr:PAS domain-containing sensor histidine kinase [Nocardioides potassii]MCF6379546.1 PAS domain-containing sensor histidine kinase [Nocardioides potassii]